jgi:hypothetical protein
MEATARLKRRSVSTTLHDAISQEDVLAVLWPVQTTWPNHNVSPRIATVCIVSTEQQISQISLNFSITLTYSD